MLGVTVRQRIKHSCCKQCCSVHYVAHMLAHTPSSSTNAGVMPALMHWMRLSGMQSISLAATTAFALITALSLRSWPTCNATTTKDTCDNCNLDEVAGSGGDHVSRPCVWRAGVTCQLCVSCGATWPLQLYQGRCKRCYSQCKLDSRSCHKRSLQMLVSQHLMVAAGGMAWQQTLLYACCWLQSLKPCH